MIMVAAAETDIVHHHHPSVVAVVVAVPDLDHVGSCYGKELEDPVAISPSVTGFDSGLLAVSDSISASSDLSEVNIRSSGDKSSDATFASSIDNFVPTIRSGSFADIGPRRYMEDEHIRIDDLSVQFGPLFNFPTPGAFYGVFDGHGGAEAASYVRRNVIRLLFEDANFPQKREVDDAFLVEIENSFRKSFLLADLALANDSNVSNSSGTTALTALILGRFLMVANIGDCRAVLCRKGEAIEMSQDHRPSYPPERRRVEELGGFIDDGYLNGVLSVTRALGDWDLKSLQGSKSPLIAEPEFKQIILTDDDEFLIIGCDGIWDVLSSQKAVSLVRRGLRRHDDPEQCAKDLVMEALRLNTFDNLTVIVICFSSADHGEASPPRQRRLRCCSLSAEALCSLRRLLDN